MNLRYAVAIALVLGAPLSTRAQVPGSCELGSAEADLNVSDVQARLFNTGSLFFGNSSQASYLVPRMTGRTPMFAAGIWVGGLVGGTLRVAGATYTDFEFWPGPLDEFTGEPPNADDCSDYDRIYVVDVRDVEAYNGGAAPAPDLRDWPVALGAEVVDGDGVPGNYNLAGGDRPRIFGTQTAFWVMNDVGNAHSNSLTPPIGLEVRVHAFAVASAEDALNQATVYRYTLVNRNDLALESAYFTLWADPDLGDAADDYVGVDVSRALAFVYNADNEDGNGSSGSYGTSPPAVGFDLLSPEAGSFLYLFNGTVPPQTDPSNGQEIYCVQQGRWTDCSPVTLPGTTTPTTFAFSGDPVIPAFWSERCPASPSNCGPPNQSGDRRMVLSSGSFSLAPGEARTFDAALVFGQGTDNINSITALRAASDAVQAAYDSGVLFATVSPVALPAPTLFAPSNGQYVGGGPVTLAWDAVPGAEGYAVDVWAVTEPTGLSAGRAEVTSYSVGGASVEVPGCGGRLNYLTTCGWRVRADAPSAAAVGHWSETRTFSMQEYAPGLLDGGESVIETANPAMAPCPDPGDFGCENYGGEGNSLFRDPNRTGDYDISSTTGRDLTLLNAGSPGAGFSRTASPFDYEIRFTEAGGYAVYNAFLGATTPKQIARVPFEIWNVGTTPTDPSDDVRMIPVLRQNSAANPLVADWEDTFVGTETRVVGVDTLTIPVTEQLAALFPDRPNGYDLFEAAAIGFGGAGAMYNPAADGDTQIDINPHPTNPLPCSRQGYYIGFCARNDQYVPPGAATVFSAAFVQLLFTDLAGDGTTPPAGTVVRLKMARYAPVANEPPAGPAGRDVVVIESVRPNPVTGSAAIAYSLPAAGTVRVVIYDVLGRAVAVLADGPAPAGRTEAALSAGALAPGVYVVTVETRDGREARTITVLR